MTNFELKQENLKLRILVSDIWRLCYKTNMDKSRLQIIDLIETHINLENS